MRKIMVRLDHPYRFAPSTHQDGVSDRGVTAYPHTPQKSGVTYAGRAENDVVSSGEIRRIKDSLQFLRSSLLDRLFLFFLVSRPHHRLEIAAKTSNCGCGQPASGHGFCTYSLGFVAICRQSACHCVGFVATEETSAARRKPQSQR